MKKKIKIVIFFGESCAGKDTALKWTLDNIPNTKRMVSCTTRKPREGEQDGVDYYFISNLEFTKKVVNFSIVEATSWCGEFYGTPIETFEEDKINVGVLDIAGIEFMKGDDRLEVLPIYIAASPRTRLLRSLNRETNIDCEKICKRFLEDLETFSKIDFEYETFINDDTMTGSTDFQEIAKIISGFAQNV